MSSKRIKVEPQPVLTRNQMEQAVAEIASLKVQEQEHTAAMNREIEAIKKTHAPKLDEINQAIDRIGSRVRDWAEANPADFGKLRSIDLTHAVIGWRTGNPALKTLKGWTWDRVLEKLKEMRLFPSYIRTAEEVNKQALLDDRDKVDLKQFGVQVAQAESFYIEAKIVQPERKEVA